MPLYLYVCSHCGHRLDEVRPMRLATWSRKCPKCKRRMHRDLGGEQPAGHGDMKPFFSEAAGCCQDDERLPGETYDAENRLLIKSYAHRRKIMRRLRMRDASSYVG